MITLVQLSGSVCGNINNVVCGTRLQLGRWKLLETN